MKRSGNEYSARCPAHDDKRNSLSLSTGENGKILIHCQAGCSLESITAAMGLTQKDLFPNESNKNLKIPIAVYQYQNGAEKLRYLDKSFTWRQPDGHGGWIYNRKGLDRCLYVAGEFSGLVLITEGEKDADNTHRQMGFNAVSGEDGAGKGKWKEEYTHQLKGHNVVILPDNDQIGQEYAQEIAAALYNACPSVKVLDLQQAWPDLPEHGDISDLLVKFGAEKTRHIILDMIEKAEQWKPKERDIFSEFHFYSVPDLTEEEKKPPDFLIDGMLPVGMSFLSGAPKIRKSFFALQLAIAVATGTPFFDRQTKQCDVCYLDLEGSKSRISNRARRMTVPIPRNVYITNAIEERLANGLVDKLRELHRQRPIIRLIIIDTYSRSRGNYRSAGVSNAYDLDVAFLEPIQRMAIEENISILFVHHDKKGAGFMADSFERLSGTMGISGSADCVMNLIADGKRFDGKATLEYTPRDAKGGEINLEFDEFSTEWKALSNNNSDILGNPVCAWIVANAPERQKEGIFISYDDLFCRAYNYQTDSPGEKIREQITPNKAELFSQYGIGIQMGVKSHGERGIRVINLL